MTVKKYILTANDVEDNLTSTLQDVPLSANQGRVLNTGKVDKNQGTQYAGKVLGIGDDGLVYPTNPSASLPIASETTLGGVKIGEGTNVTPDGKISVGGGSAVNIPKVSLENVNGFKVGTCSAQLAGFYGSVSFQNGTVQIGDVWYPCALDDFIIKNSPPFVLEKAPVISMINITVSLSVYTTLSMRTASFTANDAVTGDVFKSFGSVSKMNSPLTATLPLDEKMMTHGVKFFAETDSSSQIIAEVSISSSEKGTYPFDVSADLFFDPEGE